MLGTSQVSWNSVGALNITGILTLHVCVQKLKILPLTELWKKQKMNIDTRWNFTKVICDKLCYVTIFVLSKMSKLWTTIYIYICIYFALPPPPFVMQSHFLLDPSPLKELISVMSKSFKNVPYYLSSVEIVQTKYSAKK